MQTARAIIAEDEPLLREELAELLASLWPELAVVAETGDGIATLQALEKHSPDILFLDINMPAGTGLEVLKRLKSSTKTSLIPIIVLSGSINPAEQQSVIDQGAEQFLSKPPVFDVLEDALHRILGHDPQTAQ